ncbi:DNA repair REX1-B-domain-containing protein [Endogone sp. FLAS-F59071]|nr:DNA repair REX1-B-domain-containing protein [Endogone sp. FLAS-F59071]|eukprot:RUS16743.1 DNA repair REX1-B-domain-containing protein [Endogone sp. FLAS-F59071]
MPEAITQPTTNNDMSERVLFCMRQLLSQQSTRVALYKEFDDAYKDYLSDRCTPESYQSICQIVTEGFQEVSSQIQVAERVLKEDLEREDLAQEVRTLQELEREKLKLTANSQIFEIESRRGDKDYSESLRKARAWRTRRRDQRCTGGDPRSNGRALRKFPAWHLFELT